MMEDWSGVTCFECDSFTPCPCGCAWGLCEWDRPFLANGTEEACGDFMPSPAAVERREMERRCWEEDAADSRRDAMREGGWE